jgi:hypothetical protein
VTLLAVAKPNVALVCIAIAIHLWVARGTRFFAVAAIPAVVAAAAAVVVPCLYFRSWAIWSEWYRAVFGANPYGLARPAEGGNYSTPLLISRWLGVDVWLVAAIVAVVLGASLIAAIFASAHGFRPVQMLRRALEQMFGDPALAMAIGVTATIALPQLVWYHYFLIALIPGLWLLNAPDARSMALCGAVAIALSSGLLNVLLLPFGWTGAAGVGAALSWVPLWGGILLRLRASGAAEAAVTPAAPPTPDPRAHPEPQHGQARKSNRASRS